MMRAPFAPANGNAFAASQVNATPAARQLGQSPGANPFLLNLTPGEDAFQGVGGYDAAQVVVGLAMRMVNAPIGLVAVASPRTQVWTTTESGVFTKKVTQHVKGFTKPLWFIATPAQFQPRADPSLKICAINVATPTDCPPELVVKSGVKWTQWTGGNLPAFEDETSYWTKARRG